jgi:Leucine-rich repeat (LRR) protein
MEGVDAYFMEEGFYDNVKDAMADSEGTLYLDLSLQSPDSSLQSPKFQRIPEGVFQLKNLKHLELGFNQIGSIDDRILDLNQLEVLGLSGNKYLKSVSGKVFSMAQLKELHLKDTGLSSAQLDALKSKSPVSCKLIR